MASKRRSAASARAQNAGAAVPRSVKDALDYLSAAPPTAAAAIAAAEAAAKAAEKAAAKAAVKSAPSAPGSKAAAEAAPPADSEAAAPEMPDDEVLYDLADLFRVFGDSTRIKILYALYDSELSVGDIAEKLALSQSAVSHQLRVLKDARLVRFRRNGKAVYYALDDDHVRSILSLGMEHTEE